jgi:hypothetical protein
MYEGAYTSAAHGWSTGVVPAVPVAGAGTEVIVDGRIAWDDGSGRAFGAALADGYVTLHGVRGGNPVSVSVR